MIEKYLDEYILNNSTNSVSSIVKELVDKTTKLDLIFEKLE